MSNVDITSPLLMTETVDIVSSYVAKNSVPVADLPKLISSVHAALANLGVASAGSDGVEVVKPTADQIRKSIRPDGLTSFIDGKTYKTLKRHLGVHGLTPEGYRARYGLGADYPIVAEGYRAQRSAIAKAIGLGRPTTSHMQ